jgi:hypothetical protein
MLILVGLIEQIEELNGGQADTGAGARSLEQPFVASDRRFGPRCGRPQLDDRFAAAGDDHLLAVERPIDQFREVVLGIRDAVGCHHKTRSYLAMNIAI